MDANLDPRDSEPGPDRGDSPRLAGAPENTASQEESQPAEIDPVDPVADARDQALMRLALAEARSARDADEVPIGAIVVLDDQVVGRGRNRCRELKDPTAHAELLALREAFATTGDMRLPGATVVSTVEPCFMCAGALVHARIARVVWAVRDPKFGGAVSLGGVLTDPRSNHRATLREGVLAEEARDLMQRFFREKRAGARRAARSSDEGAGGG